MGDEDDATAGARFGRRSFLAGAGAAVVGGFVSTSTTGSGGKLTTAETSTVEPVGETPTVEATAETSTGEATAGTPVIGANLNGRPRRIDGSLELLDASETTWVRAFLDVRKKLRNGTPPKEDPDVVALGRAVREKGCKLVVSLKWDFKANWGDKPPTNVPEPGSPGERELCRAAVEYLGSIGAPVDVVVLGNEPMWETPAEDIEVEDPPIVRFTRNVKDYLLRHGDHGEPTYLVGAFNRGHDADVRERRFPHFHRRMAEWVREDADVDGVDLHVHYDDFAEAEGMVANAREAFPDAVIAATEFSPALRYGRHVHTPIGEFEAGATFARSYDLPESTTAAEYFEHAKRDPRPPEEVGDFYDAMPWYDVNFVEDVYQLLDTYDVSLGTFGFLQGLEMRNEDWTEGWTPFHINFLYQPAIMRTDRGIVHTAHPHFIEDYRERAR